MIDNVNAQEETVKNEIQELNELSGTDQTVESAGEKQARLIAAEQQAAADLESAKNRGASEEEIKDLENVLDRAQQNRIANDKAAQAKADRAQQRLADFNTSVEQGRSGLTPAEQERKRKQLEEEVEKTRVGSSQQAPPSQQFPPRIVTGKQMY